MSFQDNRIQKLYTAFIENAPCIETYFQIPHSKYTFTKKSLREYFFKIKKEKCLCIALDLPSELRVHINSYLYEYSIALYKIIIPMDYPFKAPVWTFEKVVTNTSAKGFQYAAHYQNKRYDISWSPSITFEKDILNMIDAYETCVKN